MTSAPVTIRLACDSDVQHMRNIYLPVVRDTSISFEVEPPTLEEFRRRVSSTLETLPWLVCEAKGRILGYAYAGRFRSRAGYRWSVEVSVYVDSRYRRLGVGAGLYTVLLEGLRILGYFNAYAGITLPNSASVNLHERLGFKLLAVYPSVAFKMGRWRDVGVWHLVLAEHSSCPESPKPLDYLLSSERWQQAIREAAAQVEIEDVDKGALKS